jgi:aspartyl-tRNA(Asn)/glutamyl-tRNA(Gln) amidotransferase subunit A
MRFPPTCTSRRSPEPLDETVASRFSDATKELTRNGVRLSDEQLSFIDDMVRSNAKATFAAAESYEIHRERLATRAVDFDPFVRSRIEAGSTLSAADYMAMLRGRTALARAMDARLSALDGLALPTTPIVAPTIAESFDQRGVRCQEWTGLAQSGYGQFL